MPRHYYITSGLIDLDTPIRDYRLLSNRVVADQVEAMRVTVPDDMELTRDTCGKYHTTDDTRTLRRLGPVPVVKIMGRWRRMPSLIDVQPHNWFNEMYRLGYRAILIPSDAGYRREHHTKR